MKNLARLLLILNTVIVGASVALAQTRLNGRNLLKEDAAFRADHIGDVKYDLFFDLRGAKNFVGQATIQFDLKKLPQFLTVDFVEGEVQKISLNGKSLDPASHNGSLILLKQENLVAGPNRLVLNFTHPYSTTGSGLYRFVDPEDKRVYLYTDLEPYNANNVFPCFDQPNLKATYKIAALVPKDWTVVTSVREASKKAEKNGTRWEFPESKKFSTYIFSLIAGPYKIWESKAGDVPLRLLSRQSLARYVKPEFWFTVTRQGLEFFKNYFGVAYPFLKYDQIIVPDFNSGAMENVAAVTFTERYVKRGKENRTDQFQLSSVILHEMAHMWFGNLVTMKWWGDLWLNETFATYMSFVAQDRATDFKEAWKVFASSEKAWAIWEDQMPTTHSVRAEVADTESAFANFDGITYAKGAAVMKQMSFVMGDKAFQEGLKNYFETFAYQNATYEDFMASLEKAYKKSLAPVARDWLETAGLNTVKAQWTCKDGKLSEVKLHQGLTQKEFPTLRQHKTYLGFFKGIKDGAPELIKQQEVTYQGSETTVSLSPALECPDFIYPNYQDKDFVQVSVDAQSMEFLKNHLSQFRGTPDLDLLRNSLWQNLWDDTSNARLPLATYTDILMRHLPRETEPSTLESALGTLNDVVAWAPKKNDLQKYFADRIEDFLKKSYLTAAPGSDAQQLYFDAYVSGYWNSQQTKNLEQLLNQKQIAKKFSWDPDRRWKAIESICREKSDCTRLLNIEKKRDSSQNGKLAFLKATAAQNSLKNKKAVYEELLNSKRTTIELKSYLRGLWSWNQTELQQPFQKDFYDNLIRIQEKNDEHYTSSFARFSIPYNCENADVPALTAILQGKSESLKPESARSLKISKRLFEKCDEIQKTALKSGHTVH